MCRCPFSTVLASSWEVDEAVNASLWSHQKWLWWVETPSLVLPLCFRLGLSFVPLPSPFILPCTLPSLGFDNISIFLSLFDVCSTFPPPSIVIVLITLSTSRRLYALCSDSASKRIGQRLTVQIDTETSILQKQPKRLSRQRDTQVSEAVLKRFLIFKTM